jgi:hypothetical protein
LRRERILAPVKAFLKAGILTELAESKDTSTGTPQRSESRPSVDDEVEPMAKAVDRWGP